ncbi:type II toxin-antitoxin system RelE family toxin [Sphingomonas sp. 22176]|uniref:type II toxin-antitoxin system RelE family toxin n=1 Tax=Sphingomonas sp. 22176 TaxID=3453884 RepID=UPI003F85FF7A
MRKLGKQEAGRILRTLEKRIAPLEDPRSLGAPLTGEHSGYWRWRIGHYRIIARIQDARVVILVVRVGHRREVYR